ncbi:serine hydrolase domain-containing protein [Janthinobacterium kumbetense]|uniref:Beta-lactamase n=1 Tax=Janthinobacterium kumbetense TaxID=2950280 RepID=A0ABT0WN06_9BURK|nr:serine hydrolase domain-containing protein [Janthinobacterium kumbetense]MCM2565449.1 beta-lactamase family protein [Janthinobacterium kumbetense]
MVRMMIRLAAITTGMTLLLAACKPAATVPAHDIPAAMRQTATTLLQSKLLHATSIALVYRGQEFILHQGELETGKANPPNDTTLYEIGSVSKTFAGLLLANAVLDGKATLDDPIQKYLPAAYPNLQSQGQPVRLRHLITHTSNMPGMLPLQVNTVLQDFTAHATPAKLNAAYANYGQPQFWQDLHTVNINGPLGKDYAYSSAGTELVAHALETIYGMPYEVLLTQLLAREAGMHDTRLKIAAQDAGRLAPGYHSDNPVITTPMPQLPWGAAGNLKSTMPDMAKYLRLQLSAHPAVVESHKPLLRFQDDFSIAYFWNIGTNRQLGTHYVHHGGVPRAQGYAYIVPKYQLGVYIITNQSGDATAGAMESALAHIFDTVASMESAQ